MRELTAKWTFEEIEDFKPVYGINDPLIPAMVLCDNKTACDEYPRHRVVDVLTDVEDWIESQPLSQWKYTYSTCPQWPYTRVIVTEELYTLMALKWL